MATIYAKNKLTGEWERVGPAAAATDATLTLSGSPADAKATGEAIDNIQIRIENLTAEDVGALPSSTEIPSMEGLASEAYVNERLNERITEVVGGAPELLNTLDELSAALNDDENFATTVTNQIATKQDKLTGTEGQYVGFNVDGNAVAQDTLGAEDAIALLIELGFIEPPEEPINKPIVLEVKKITSNSFNREQNLPYTDNNFIMLNVYPKTNGTVSVKYGNRIKTITDTSGAAEPAAQQVIFGYFNGSTYDGLAASSPSSGTLTIEGDCSSFNIGTFNTNKTNTGYCSCITAVHDLGNITRIEDYAFYNCTDITSVTIPNSVTEIGMNAFKDCTSLASVTISNSVTKISLGAFEGCTSLTSITIPDSITEIGQNTFKDCTSLASITMSNSVSDIRTHTFEGCTSLASITIPNSVTSIYGSAFEGCTSLASITIPDSVTEIGQNTFKDCTSLASVSFDNTDGWFVANTIDATSGTPVDVTDPVANVTLLNDTYKDYYWKRA